VASAEQLALWHRQSAQNPQKKAQTLIAGEKGGLRGDVTGVKDEMEPTMSWKNQINPPRCHRRGYGMGRYPHYANLCAAGELTGREGASAPSRGLSHVRNPPRTRKCTAARIVKAASRRAFPAVIYRTAAFILFEHCKTRQTSAFRSLKVTQTHILGGRSAFVEARCTCCLVLQGAGFMVSALRTQVRR
jgi:hypothetical protein